ncbi:DNA cytosine methyltransferase [Alterisphingorhabdus coralli]|uniref:Cytosine-specific methyltransferase n=1 Tax=Alterisphingorhabdus coralli TaxID=3071408 RepID=A0AA97HZE9_9SPHN|nr:DNA cytosine methyltransferase [Parasphingorhabdus sp. SCSIO 66989]WOE74569.1 DNA cytosine methyltransferase [Parasphingorhabdus sp. SCSIO 66989]
MGSAIDIFSGAGGLSLGLQKAGWDVQAAIEFDQTASETHRKNIPESEHICADVRDVAFRKYFNIDLIAGGPPCQPFSVSGKRLGQFDLRDMVPQFVRAVAEAKPKAFLMENVAGLTNRRFRSYLDEKINDLHSLGYTVFSKVLNAADYGVAQKRKRLMLVGIRSDQDGIFHFPQETHGDDADFPFYTTSQCLKDVPDDVPNKAKVVFCKNPVLRKSPYAGMLFNGKGRPLESDGLAHTIPASAGGNRTHILDPLNLIPAYHACLMKGEKPRTGELQEVRRITVRESARIQSFPDNFEFVGRQSSRYSQVGNAVPPKLAYEMGNALAQSIL